VVTSMMIEAQVRMDCDGGDWKARAEDGRGKGLARSFIGRAMRGKRKGSRWDWSPTMCGRRRYLAFYGRAIGGRRRRKVRREEERKGSRKALTGGANSAVREKERERAGVCGRCRPSGAGRAGSRSADGHRVG